MDVINTSDLTNTNAFLTRFELESSPLDVAIGAGLGYVAAGSDGLHVVNYLSFDSAGQAPTVQAIGPDSSNLEEGSLVAYSAIVIDDVQVQRVELLMNGQVVATDLSTPFNLNAVVPPLAAGGQVQFQVRAWDTGGNVGTSTVESFTVIPDQTPPQLIASSPQNNGAGFQLQTASLRFNEPLNEAALNLTGFTLTDLGANFELGGGDDTNLPIAGVRLVSPRNVALDFGEALPQGRYQLTISPSVIRDGAGNALAEPVRIIFTNFDANVANAVAWISDADGNWNDPANWSTGVVPGPDDNVIIDRFTADPKITINSGTVQVRSIRSAEPLQVINNATLIVTEPSILDNTTNINGARSKPEDPTPHLPSPEQPMLMEHHCSQQVVSLVYRV
ncbi:MAG: Ig-like domain-containing protein [Pirellulaceae bacterium]